MKHWMEYVKASYEMVLIAEERAHITLEHEVEAWTVHTLARYMEQPHIPTDAVALSMMRALGATGQRKKAELQRVAEECLLVDGLQLNRRRWPSQHYFRDMGRIALENRAWIEYPPEHLYERVAQQFDTISRVLHNVRVID